MRSLIIWTYHRVLPTGGNAAVDAKLFERQLACLSSGGYQFIQTDQLRRWIEGKETDARRPVMLTFDDGWGDNLFHATPLLKKYGAKAVLALNTGLINPNDDRRLPGHYPLVDSKEALRRASVEEDFESFLTWPEIRELRDSGVWDIQAHGHSHDGCYQKESFENIRGFYPDKTHWTMAFALGEPPFEGAPRGTFVSTLAKPRTVLSESFKKRLLEAKTDVERRIVCEDQEAPIVMKETEEQYRNRVRDDLATCRSLIETELGLTPASFFWPWGQSSNASRSIARDIGFDLQFTMQKSPVTPKVDRTRIPRVAAPANFAKFKRDLWVFGNPLLSWLRRFFRKRRERTT